ncbi:uncharacterized protein LOC123270743 [Cotesia glomerata]|uniref:uncharacterized protein LOC123270743 n=1 Tax=Cotesia glomerata TaxID=32391 RepID=UPI001D02B2A3|nr:uncharacterized protein LOC123270743 [Cotesia glomerata]
MYYAIKFAKLVLATFFINYIALNVNGLECYVCESKPSSADYCVKIHNNFKTYCPRKYCTIFRKELRDIYEGNNQLNYMNRSCSDQKMLPEQIIVADSQVRVFNTENFRRHNIAVITDEFQYYFQSCESDLCNNGDGVESSDNDPKSRVLIVPGIGTNLASSLSSSNYFIFIACIFIFTNKFINF